MAEKPSKSNFLLLTYYLLRTPSGTSLYIASGQDARTTIISFFIFIQFSRISAYQLPIPNYQFPITKVKKSFVPKPFVNLGLIEPQIVLLLDDFFGKLKRGSLRQLVLR